MKIPEIPGRKEETWKENGKWQPVLCWQLVFLRIRDWRRKRGNIQGNLWCEEMVNDERENGLMPGSSSSMLHRGHLESGGWKEEEEKLSHALPLLFLMLPCSMKEGRK